MARKNHDSPDTRSFVQVDQHPSLGVCEEPSRGQEI